LAPSTQVPCLNTKRVHVGMKLVKRPSLALFGHVAGAEEVDEEPRTGDQQGHASR